ncbi:MAG: ATP-binding cassette domain-containing protein [Candidatus Coatesbacteria bacterium]
MIEVEGLRKQFGTTVALNDVSFRVDRGEVVGLLGPNGAGKTTMMRVLTGYLPPTAGTVRVGGHDVREEPIEVRRLIGYLPETVPVYAELTVREYLQFAADLREVPKAEVADRMARAMGQTGTAEVAHRVIGHLSKGYRQRVGLAQALLHDPALLILDEPTVGLDPSQVVEIRTLVRELATHRTVILSSHILSEVSQICTRVIVIHRGRIVGHDTVADLEKRLKGAERVFVQVRAPGVEALEAIRALPGVTAVTPAEAQEGTAAFQIECELGRDVREDVSRLALDRHWPILDLRSVAMSLEEMFLKLTGAGGGS